MVKSRLPVFPPGMDWRDDDSTYLHARPSLPGALPGAPGVLRNKRQKSARLLADSSQSVTHTVRPRMPGRTTVSFSSEALQAIGRVAAQEGRSQSDAVRLLVKLGAWTYDTLLALHEPPSIDDLSQSLQDHLRTLVTQKGTLTS